MALSSEEESNVRFVLTLNMPSATGMLVHQITVDISLVNSCRALCELMNKQDFIIGHQLYKRRGLNGDTIWEDRGDVIINTAHVGKVQEFYETEESRHDESHRGYDSSRSYSESKRGPIRPR